MRIARVLLARAPDEDRPPFPIVALERDGALYDVAELDRIFGTPYAPDLLPGASDFHTRVIALRGAGLEALDERLCGGERPFEARLLPGTFLWLAPCDTDRTLYVQLPPHDAPPRDPWFQLGNGRGLLGHGSAVPFPAGEARPDFELGVAAVLGEDLCAADPAAVEGAILGYTILNGWCGRDDEARRPGLRLVPAQLGPVVVTADEVGDVTGLRAQARIDGRVVVDRATGGWPRALAESIAWVSRFVDLHAGDVIGGGCLCGGSGAASGCVPGYGATVELLVERLGKLSGRPRTSGNACGF